MLGLLVGGSQALLRAGDAGAPLVHALQLVQMRSCPGPGALSHTRLLHMRLHMESGGPLQATNHKHRDFTLT